MDSSFHQCVIGEVAFSDILYRYLVTVRLKKANGQNLTSLHTDLRERLLGDYRRIDYLCSIVAS